MTHDELRELLGAYALDALPAQEKLDVDAHCTTCRDCADEAQRLHAVSDQLALIAPEREPPPLSAPG